MKSSSAIAVLFPCAWVVAIVCRFLRFGWSANLIPVGAVLAFLYAVAASYFRQRARGGAAEFWYIRVDPREQERSFVLAVDVTAIAACAYITFLVIFRARA